MSDKSIPLACQHLLYNWANSIDTKAWASLLALFAPMIDVDYSALGLLKAAAVQPALYVRQVSSPRQLGNPDIQTQHMIGACKWTRESESHARVAFQILAAHRREPQAGDAAILATGHGVNTMDFAQIDGEWKIAALKVGVLWVEGDINDIFKPRL
ncbi:conidial pigment biosynthesis scytalone dehydratase Arp1 [Aspergillus pseudonomiae]|uniref:Conidial pigment biosynthesis scytalone dehydratase Arp1 n=1 Tax=Aspergillus pseudonomiae TaxID=1506151 RepID=A0A5N6IHP7_9EURO|nr:conidial pigment biosynthesis scytalone dehydratase Arp1 [Aspergillus pseudonomiae]KAB8265390.1 conidial pigment biosynthesis scytalone dehydratase Arp1 [Aspergillus pseudonomiae]KAE8402406.1 conidial pigment biosynthesis scytalone dehydratase Arp1 [Aspergillus pseudonomiae]